MGDAWRAIEDSHIKGRGRFFKPLGIKRAKRDFCSINIGTEVVGYGCTPRCCSIIAALAGHSDDNWVSPPSVTVRNLRTVDNVGVTLDNRDIKCSLGCDPYVLRFPVKEAK